jgi:hypothetical protein
VVVEPAAVEGDDRLGGEDEEILGESPRDLLPAPSGLLVVAHRQHPHPHPDDLAVTADPARLAFDDVPVADRLHPFGRLVGARLGSDAVAELGADDFGGGPPVEPLGGGVPAADRAVGGHRRHRVLGVVDDRLQVAVLLLGRLTAADVADREDEVRRLGDEPGDPAADRDVLAPGEDGEGVEGAFVAGLTRGGREEIAPAAADLIAVLGTNEQRGDLTAEHLLAPQAEEERRLRVPVDDAAGLVEYQDRLAAPGRGGQRLGVARQRHCVLCLLGIHGVGRTIR